MYKIIIVVLAALSIALNLAAWIIPSFCDWYTAYVTPLWFNSFGRFMNLFPFSVGEIMLVIAVILVIFIAAVGIIFLFNRKKQRIRGFAKSVYKSALVIFLAVCLVMTLNCSILYHCTPIDPNFDAEYREYTLNELETARNYIVEQCNYYSGIMERDDEGYIVYNGDMQKEAKDSLHNISDMYPKLAGYYPDVKHMAFSNLVSQAYIEGYYFPFSMEANCNSNMYIMNYPEVYCHELSHLHGYIYEDEANFISFLACTKSSDDFFVYSGYLGVLNYIDNAYVESLGDDLARYGRQVKISEQVKTDNAFLLPETWERVEASAVLSTDTVNNASDAIMETSLHANGVSDGMAVYGKVVDLLLQYYDGTLY